MCARAARGLSIVLLMGLFFQLAISNVLGLVALMVAVGGLALLFFKPSTEYLTARARAVKDAPRPVRIAVGLWLAIAVFVLFTTAGLWFQRGEMQAAHRVGLGSGDELPATLTVVVR